MHPADWLPADWLPGTNPVAEEAASGSAIGDARFAEWQRPRIEKLIRIFDGGTGRVGSGEDKTQVIQSLLSDLEQNHSVPMMSKGAQ